MNIKEIKLNYDYLLVDEDSVDSTRSKEGGVLLPETREDFYPETGLVLKSGPGRYDKKLGRFITNQFKAGQRVMFNQRAGQPLIIDGKKYRLLRDSDILAIYLDESNIYPGDDLPVVQG
jgi:chaperonin GroES